VSGRPRLTPSTTRGTPAVSDNSKILARLEALEARVQELEDERAIRDLLSRYGYTADSCKDEAFVDLYTNNFAYVSHRLHGASQKQCDARCSMRPSMRRASMT